MTDVAIIIPTFNEAIALERTLRCLSILHPPAKEIIIVDGGSQDQTVAIAQAFPSSHFPAPTQLKVISSQQAGRSIQMNRGAAIATANYLCFLHADTLVPDDLVRLIDRTLANPRIVGGGFILLMTGTEKTRWIFSLLSYLKTYCFPLVCSPRRFFRGMRLIFGDQVIFCRRRDFWQCDGFDATLPIMEETDLCLKLVNLGRLKLVNRVVWSSDRRVAQWGVWKASLIYFWVALLWSLGVPAVKLKRIYTEIR